jgi:outer membrane lipoprotein SlyB
MHGVLLALLTSMAVALAMLLASAGALAQGKSPCDNCGVIESIAPVNERQVWTPLGAVTPGSMGMAGLGGTSGSTTQMSFGPGGSNQGLVVLGAAGGAVYAQRPSEYQRQRWDVTVKMDNGPPRILNMRYEPLLVQPGDRVRVSGNNIELVGP